MKELVSIIIPVHNSSKYLESCINSVINQSYKNIEIIAVENGSTDNSLEILKKYSDKIHIEVLDNSNLGLARNIGIKLSTGYYISFIDSDDFVEENFISSLVNNLEENNSDLSICNIKEIHEETKKTIIRNEYPKEIITNNVILENLDKFNYGPCNKLYKSKIIKENNIHFLENIKYEDLPFVLNYINKVKSISKVNKALYIYNIHKESEQTSIDKRIFDIITSLNECKKFTDTHILENIYIKTLLTYILKTRYIKDKTLRNEFLKESFKELNNNYPNWKKSKYFKNESFIKRLIVSNKLLLSIYLNIYNYM